MMSFLPITVCFVYFKSLSLANLEASLYALARQDMTQVEAIVVLDNDTEDSEESIQRVIDSVPFSAPINLLSAKHGKAERTHSWSTNIAVRAAFTPWVLFTRADYLLEFGAVEKMVEVLSSKPESWNGFITGNVYHLAQDIGVCNRTEWRQRANALRELSGSEEQYTSIDSGVWLMRRSAFEQVEGLNETLTAWGHAQTHFQYKLHQAGVEFVRIPEVLFYHPQHAAPRDIVLANEQLESLGVDIRDMWARYEGTQPYGRKAS